MGGGLSRVIEGEVKGKTQEEIDEYLTKNFMTKEQAQNTLLDRYDEDVFNKHTNKDGVVPLNIVMKILKEQEVADAAAVEKLKALFHKLDMNDDGKVSRSEWMGSLKTPDIKKQCGVIFGVSVLENVGGIFDALDMDNTNDISWEEFLAAAATFSHLKRIYHMSQNKANHMSKLSGSPAVVLTGALGRAITNFGPSSLAPKDRKNPGTGVLLTKMFGGSTIIQIGNTICQVGRGRDPITWDDFLVISRGLGELRTIWSKIEKDGSVSASEWGGVLQGTEWLSLTEAAMKKVFGRVTLTELGILLEWTDFDGSATIVWQEFLRVGFQLAQLAVAFGNLKSNADGTVNISEWSVLTQHSKSFRAIDGDGSGAVTFHEYLTIQHLVGKFYNFFKSLDLNNDGKISAQEWSKGLRNSTIVTSLNKYHAPAVKKLLGTCSLSDIGNAFRVIDTDGDGYIQWEEFLDTLQVLAQLQTLFHRLDKNKDLTVSTKEWTEGLADGSLLGKAATCFKGRRLAKCFRSYTLSDITDAFKMVDLNDDNKLTWDEFLSGVWGKGGAAGTTESKSAGAPAAAAAAVAVGTTESKSEE